VFFFADALPGLLQAINALDKQADLSETIFKSDWLDHVDHLGKFSIQVCTFDI